MKSTPLNQKSKARILWLKNYYWNSLIQKSKEMGFCGKGHMERFFEQLAIKTIILLESSEEIEFSIKAKRRNTKNVNR